MNKKNKITSQKITQPQRNNRIPLTISGLVLISVIFLLYFQNFSFDYTNFDDDAIIMRNESFLNDFSNIKYSFTLDAEFQSQTIELYRPLQNFSFFIDALIFGVNSFGFHFTNILLHFLSCFVLFILLKKLQFSDRLSLLGALIFAVHPIFGFTVSWIPARGDLLLCLFSLLTILFYIEWAKSKTIKALVLHAITFALALFSKETALIIIPLVLLYQYLIPRNFKFEIKIGFLWVFYLAIIIMFFNLREQSITTRETGQFGLFFLFNNLPVVPETILKFFVPVNIVVLPFFSMSRTLGGLAIIILFVWLILKFGKNHKIKLWALIWFLGFSLPAMAYNPEWSEYIYRYLLHRSYLPLIGILIPILLVAQSLENKYSQKVFTFASIVLILILGIMNLSFTKNFSNPEKFWSYAVKTNPESAFAHVYLGNVYFMKDNFTEADKSYTRSIDIKPNYYYPYLNRGTSYLSQNKFAEAISDFSKTIELQPKNTKALRIRAVAYQKAGDLNHAINDISTLISIDPNNNEHYYNKAFCEFLLKDYNAVEKSLEDFLIKKPDDINARKMFSIALLQNNNPDEAEQQLLKILELTPNDISVKINLAYTLWEKNEFIKALSILQEAKIAEPENIDAILGLLICHQSLGNKAEIPFLKEKAITISPQLTDGNNGITKLENQGYVFTKRQKDILLQIFK